MPLNLLSAIGQPALVLDDRARVIGMNSAAVEHLGLGRGCGMGRACFEVVRATDAGTGSPCEEACPVTARSNGNWLDVRRLAGLGRGNGRTSCLLVRAALLGSPLSLAVFESEAASNESGAALAEEVATRLVPALQHAVNTAGAALAVLASALRVTGAHAGEVRLAAGSTGALVRSAAIGEPTWHQVVPGSPAGRDAVTIESLRDRRLAISPLGAPVDTVREAGLWAVTAPVHRDSRLVGALTVAGRPPGFSIPDAARTLRSLAGHLGLFMRWYPQGGDTQRIRIHTLGGFSVEVDGTLIPPTAFGRKSAFEVLKILAARDGHVATRAELAAALWPDSPRLRAASNLRAVLHSLRHGLDQDVDAASFVVAGGDRIWLDRSQLWIDSNEFERARTSFLDLVLLGRRQEAVQAGIDAVGLYRGPFLGNDCSDDSIVAERARLHRLFVDLSVRVARQLILAGNREAAEQCITNALATDPEGEQQAVDQGLPLHHRQPGRRMRQPV